MTMSGHGNALTTGLRLPTPAPAARARSRSPAPPRSTSSAPGASAHGHGDGFKARPAWNDNIHDLDQLKLTPDQARKKKQLQIAYAPSRVAAVSPSRSSRRPSVSPSSSFPAPTTTGNNAWPTNAPRPTVPGRRPSTTPPTLGTAARRGSSSSNPLPPAAAAHLDADLAPRGRAPRRHVMRDAADLAYVSGRMSANAFRKLRTALLVARQVAMGASEAGIEMEFDDEDGYPMGTDDGDVDRVAEVAAGSVLELAKRMHLLDQRLATECDMRRRLDGQVKVLSEQVRKLSDQVALLDARPPASRNPRADEGARDINAKDVMKRIDQLEAAMREKQTADHIAALDDLFSSLDL
ncbi:hypothetical protein BCR44DRAFT_1440234 [Catenaria anguillulae PL171]|uniref:Uncharacterized protein n=1 Tax=Catenaria anguillulae PL171 TaxID=765915 RepID=A0A1Y2HCY0_9FUNG|nr:hypothetical protein BCR44DRAFT_1440234 [Catenaria anguillulae PL171]